MNLILSELKKLSFWGIIFIIILVFAFKVRFLEIISLATNGPNYLNVFCIFMVLSIVVFPITAVVIKVSQGLSILDMIAIRFPPDLWMPYKGITVFRDSRREKNDPDIDKQAFAFDVVIFINRFIDTVLWWAIVVFGVYEIFHTGDNAIKEAVQDFSMPHVLFVLACIVALYILLCILMSVIGPKISRWQIEREDRKYY